MNTILLVYFTLFFQPVIDGGQVQYVREKVRTVEVEFKSPQAVEDYIKLNKYKFLNDDYWVQNIVEGE